MNGIGLFSILFGLPAAVGTFVVLLLLAQWWIGMTVCPGCGRRRPKTAVNEEGNACWYCEQRKPRRIAFEPGCHKCGSPLTIPTKRTPKAQADMQLELTVRLGVGCGLLSAASFVFVGQIAPATRLIGVFVAGTVLLALAYDLARRAAAWERVPRGTD